MFALLALSYVASPDPVLERTASGFSIRIGESAILRSRSRSEATSHLESEPAQPVFLGYPHGPKDAQFVPKGAKRVTLSVALKGPFDAQIRASDDSFTCTTRSEAPLASSFGSAGNAWDDSVYDRKGDWLLSVWGDARISRTGRGQYRLRVGKGAAEIHVRPDYYRNHQGYFLWDQSKPLWKQPVAGWCSWMAHLQDVTEADVLGAAKFFSKNLKDYGYSVIQIDDGYQRVLQFPKGSDAPKEPFYRYWTVPNEKFPSGLAPLASAITKLGLTPGIWVGDYLPLGLKHGEGYVTDPDGKPHKGPWVNYAMNALIPAARDEAYIDTVRELRRQGWRYFKIDTLRHVLYDSYRQVPGYWAGRGESLETAFRTLLSETKKAAGPDSYLLACWGTMPELAGIPDGARIGEDVAPDVPSMRRSAKYISQFHYLNNVVWRNDPDYMCLRVPVDQARAWATLTALAGGHLMVSDPVSAYDEARKDVLRRVGPPLMLRPDNIGPHVPNPEYMTLHAAKNGEQWTVAARFVWDEQMGMSTYATLESLGLDPKRRYLAFDFWNSKPLGTISDGVVPFGDLKEGTCQVISLRPDLGRPQVLGTDRHIGQGAYELEGVRWDGKSLSGKMKRGAGREWSLYLHVPRGWRLSSVEGGRYEIEGEVVKIRFPESASPAEWKAVFDPRG